MSLLPVVFLPSARDDIDTAYLAYEQQQAGFGSRFAEAVRFQVARIQCGPCHYGLVYQDIRAVCVRHFPYVVFYRIEPNRVLVIAVQHGSRDWSNWQSRT